MQRNNSLLYLKELMNFKPMLAATVTDRAKLRFPYLASPKLDGIRCVILNGEVLSRSLKPIRNKFIQATLSGMPDMDGELIVGSPTGADVFNRTTRGVMSADGEPDFQFHAFDTLDNLQLPFQQRLVKIPQTWDWVAPVLHVFVQSLNDLGKYEEQMLARGYEGVMLRGLGCYYKCGRATATENSLWKLKQFTDGELYVCEVREGVMNNNVATTDALGRTVRSKHQENMVPNGQVGTIIGHDMKTGQKLEISPGTMTHVERAYYWEHPEAIVEMVVKYKCFNYGSIDAPRFATYQGMRDPSDM